MPRWLARIFYALRGKRRVRLHCVTPGENTRDLTFEGIEVGVWAGHYVLMRGQVVEAEDTKTEPSEGLFEIPKERVIFREVLAVDGRL